MKVLLLLLISSIQIFALNIFLNSAKEKQSSYAVLHIIDHEPIDCKTVPLPLDKKEYLCEFNKTIDSPIESKKLKLVDIDFLNKNDRFFLKIIPKVASRISVIKAPLYSMKNVHQAQNHKGAKHWVIVLYNKPPFGQKDHAEGINFPITYEQYQMPYIGPVDLNGAPISYAAGDDINAYLTIQKEYENKDYISTIRDVESALKKYPSTIFKSDLWRYKLNALDHILENESDERSNHYSDADLAKEAKAWIREFSSSENIPEVLYLLVKDYLRIGSGADVEYFLDILMNEHPENPYTKKAILAFADSLYQKGKKEKAIQLYKDVLYSTKDLDIASEAAIHLTNSNIDMGNLQEAKDYLAKVLDANKNYLLQDTLVTQKLAEKLAANRLAGMAAKLSDMLLENLGKDPNAQRELLLKESGDWHAKHGDIKEAYARYEAYKKRYPYGDYIDHVNRALDELFFETDENNETKLLNYYNVLIGKYNNFIKDKAIIEKAKLLIKNGQYAEVLKMKDLLMSIKNEDKNSSKALLYQAGYALVDQDLKNHACERAILVLETHKLELHHIQDKAKLFTCLMRTSRYQKANQLAQSMATAGDLNHKFGWLERLINVKAKLLAYQGIPSLEKDLMALSKILKKSPSETTYRSLFRTYYSLKQYNKALNILDSITKKWPNNIKNTELYYQMALYASRKQDDLLLIKYARDIMALQDKYQILLHSPNIEFLLIDALKRIGKPKEALAVAERLKTQKLDDNDKARSLYELGELSVKLKDDSGAKSYFETCSKIKGASAWKSLCIENMSLL
ncbi:tetratricopeptide repeat protein [Sulfurospirillum sp. 1612]|uniref:tetratricopeptide repeat protein n=1 Tax=Sulfurospirillum sp. 1612 TaxID=3094835 RepID=UPI002F959930